MSKRRNSLFEKTVIFKGTGVETWVEHISFILGEDWREYKNWIKTFLAFSSYFSRFFPFLRAQKCILYLDKKFHLHKFHLVGRFCPHYSNFHRSELIIFIRKYRSLIRKSVVVSYMLRNYLGILSMEIFPQNWKIWKENPFSQKWY